MQLLLQVDFEIHPPSLLVPQASNGSAPDTLNTPEVAAHMATVSNTLVTAALNGSLQSGLGDSFPVEALSLQAPPPPPNDDPVNAAVTPPPTVSLGKGQFTFDSASFPGTASTSGPSSMTVTVTRANGTFTNVTASYETYDLAASPDNPDAPLAVAGVDYAAVSGTLAFPVGVGAATFTVPLAVLGPEFIWPPKEFGVRITAASNGASVGANPTSVAAIAYGGQASTLVYALANAPGGAASDAAGPVCYGPGYSQVVVTLTRSGNVAGPASLTLSLAPAGSSSSSSGNDSLSPAVYGRDIYSVADNTAAAVSVDFAAGQSVAVASLPIYSPSQDEAVYAQVVLTHVRNVVSPADTSAPPVGPVVCFSVDSTALSSAAQTGASAGMIAGATIGTLVAALALVGVVTALYIRRARHNRAAANAAVMKAAPPIILKPFHTNPVSRGSVRAAQDEALSAAVGIDAPADMRAFKDNPMRRSVGSAAAGAAAAAAVASGAGSPGPVSPQSVGPRSPVSSAVSPTGTGPRKLALSVRSPQGDTSGSASGRTLTTARVSPSTPVAADGVELSAGASGGSPAVGVVASPTNAVASVSSRGTSAHDSLFQGGFAVTRSPSGRRLFMPTTSGSNATPNSTTNVSSSRSASSANTSRSPTTARGTGPVSTSLSSSNAISVSAPGSSRSRYATQAQRGQSRVVSTAGLAEEDPSPAEPSSSSGSGNSKA